MPIKNIDAKSAKSLLEQGKAVIVDVREPAEHAAEKIENAKLIPLSQVCKSVLPNCEGKKLIIHCRSGKRSAAACEKLLQEDPNLEIHNLEGGIMAWSAAGCDVKNSGKFFLPLDRQVQVTIGLSVLVGTALGYFVNAKFFIIPAFFGAGLTFAGLTGFCGLAVLMAKMPWNQSCGVVTSCSFSAKLPEAKSKCGSNCNCGPDCKCGPDCNCNKN